jgi:hypothetical protein
MPNHCKLFMSHFKVYKLLQIRLRFKIYKHECFQHAATQDEVLRYVCCCGILSKLENEEVLANKPVFCNKDTFQLSWYANGQNLWMLGQNNPP